MVDEVGAYNGSRFGNSILWAKEFIAFVSDWVNNRGGNGVIGFVWYWSDPNTMVTVDSYGNDNPNLTEWGDWVYHHYLQAVP